MAGLDRVRVSLLGFNGAPGVATHYGLNGPALFPSVVALWGALAVLMPAAVSVKTLNSGDRIEDTTGDIVGDWSIAPTTGVVGGSDGVYAAPCGAVITWLTSNIVAGHRLRGKTFVVPLSSSSYQNDGSLNTATLTEIQTRADAYVAAQSGNAAVWSRPFAGSPATTTRPARPARPGSHGIISGALVHDKIAVLRSRRD